MNRTTRCCMVLLGFLLMGLLMLSVACNAGDTTSQTAVDNNELIKTPLVLVEQEDSLMCHETNSGYSGTMPDDYNSGRIGTSCALCHEPLE